MEDINKAIEFLQAYKEGKTIEYYETNKWKPVFSFKTILGCIHSDIELRVKPELKYRPYINAEEFLRDSKKHGPYISIRYGNTTYNPTVITDEGIKIDNDNFISWSTLFYRYLWSDINYCGIPE